MASASSLQHAQNKPTQKCILGSIPTSLSRCGDGLCTDTVPVPTGEFAYYQLVADTVVPHGMVYPMKLKSQVADALELHMANNYRPYFILADGDSVNQHGKTKAMAQRHLVSLRASTPYRQWQDPAERYIHRWGRILTYLMLDSQAPVKFQLDAARHACRILSILSIKVPAAWLQSDAINLKLAKELSQDTRWQTAQQGLSRRQSPSRAMRKRSSRKSKSKTTTSIVTVADITDPDPMVATCAFYVLFRTNPDLRVFKRWCCLAYVRSEKSQREKFRQHGEFAAVLGIAGDRYDEWTYEVYLFRSKSRVARRDILFREDIMPFAQGRLLLSFDPSQTQDLWVRRAITPLDPALLREDEDSDLHLDGWDSDALAMAAHNLSKDPRSWMALRDDASCPISVGDTIYCGSTENTVLNVSPAGIRVPTPGSPTEGIHLIPPATPIYQDDLGAMGRPTRHRTQRTFYVSEGNPTGTPLPPRHDMTGADLIG
jgi:hypothetical protein